MRTEIFKSFSWGFVATEQDFRRLIQAAMDHLLKPAGSVMSNTKYEVKLKDGSVFETASLDDVFQLENAGNKLVREVACHLSATHAGGDCAIDIELKDGSANTKNWHSAVYRVSGDTRDWAFVAASELDERLKRMKVMAWEALFSKRWSSLLLMLAVMVIALLCSVYLRSPNTAHVQMEALYKAGHFANPIEAIIELEKIKSSRQEVEILMPLFSMWGTLFLVIFGGGYLLPKLSPSYNFCWGEYTAVYAKRIRLRNGIFSLVVLALIVSVLANFVSKKLGI